MNISLQKNETKVVDSRPFAGQPLCEVCGGGARVGILACYSAGKPLIHRFCMPCADERGPILRRPVTDTRSGSLLILVGGLCALLTILSDYLPGFSGQHPGFGLMQDLGLLLAVCGIVFGAILRIDLLALSGSCLLLLVLSADLISLTRSPGIGWRQALVLAGCLGILLAGTALRFRQVRQLGRLAPGQPSH